MGVLPPPSVFLVFFVLLNYTRVVSSYETYYLENECLNGSVSFELSGEGPGSAALLRASKKISYSMQLACRFRVVAPPDRHVTLSVREIDFRTNWDGTCIDYVVIKGQNYCKHLYREEEERHFDSTDVTPTNALEVLYHTTGDNRTLSGFVGFTFTITAFRQGGESGNGTFECSNGHLIWQGLTCDGHNNCGDMSDEEQFGPADCEGSGGGPSALIILALIIVFLLLVMCVATLACSKNESVQRIRSRTISFMRARRYGNRNSSSALEDIGKRGTQ